MSTWQRVAGFAVAVAVVFAASFGIGRAVGPLDADTEEHGHDDRLSLTPASGLELDLARTRYDAGSQRLLFTIRDGSGEPVTAYDVQHEKQLHLIAVRRDLVGYHHVHPTLDTQTGQWQVPVDLTDGDWRLYADFLPTGGEAQVLEADIEVGTDRPTELRAVNDTAVLPGGYEVHLERTDDMATFHVTRDGEEVTDLEPYLGAYGHLVAIRAGSLEYVHAHPEDGEPGPEVGFHVELPEAGTYGLWLDFQHDGVVRTAAFMVEQGESADVPTEETTEQEGEGHDH
jgi:hypothetical protein